MVAELIVGDRHVAGEVGDVSRTGLSFITSAALSVGDAGVLERPKPLAAAPVRIARATPQPDGRVAFGLDFEGEGPFPAIAGGAAEDEDV
jgi:hypothetical protein